MNDLSIAATQATPAVRACVAQGTLHMEGDSYPENSFEFFEPIFCWVSDFVTSSSQPLRLDLHLLYLNTSSVKAMMDIFDLLEDAHAEGHPVAVQWFYDQDNERIAELAEEFKEDCSFPFQIARAA